MTGNRLQVSSSFGANVLSKRDKMGQVTNMVAYLDKERPWAAKMAYNATGQEVLRQVSGGVVNSFAYDELGNVCEIEDRSYGNSTDLSDSSN